MVAKTRGSASEATKQVQVIGDISLRGCQHQTIGKKRHENIIRAPHARQCSVHPPNYINDKQVESGNNNNIINKRNCLDELEEVSGEGRLEGHPETKLIDPDVTSFQKKKIQYFSLSLHQLSSILEDCGLQPLDKLKENKKEKGKENKREKEKITKRKSMRRRTFPRDPHTFSESIPPILDPSRVFHLLSTSSNTSLFDHNMDRCRSQCDEDSIIEEDSIEEDLLPSRDI